MNTQFLIGHVWVVVYCKAQREYTVCYRDRNIPSPQGFTCLHQRLTESGSVQKQRNEVGPAQDVLRLRTKLATSGRRP